MVSDVGSKIKFRNCDELNYSEESRKLIDGLQSILVGGVHVFGVMFDVLVDAMGL